MFGSLGPGEIILILVVLLLVFGAKRLPELGGALGKGIREFRSSVKDIEKQVSGDGSTAPPQQQAMQPPQQTQGAIPQPPVQAPPQNAQPAQQQAAPQQSSESEKQG